MLNQNSKYFFIIILLGFTLISCGDGLNDSTGLDSDDFDQKIHSLASQDAIDCGRVAVGEDRETVDNCVIDSFTERQPFYARYDFQGIDSQVAFAIIFHSDGHTDFLQFDSDPLGRGRSDSGIIYKSSCQTPELDHFYDQTDGLPIMCQETR